MVVAIVASLRFLSPHDLSGVRVFNIGVLFFLLVYLLGMYREFGVDYITYAEAYYHDRSLIPDLGYSLLTTFSNEVGMSLSAFFLLQGGVTLIAISRFSRKLNADIAVVLFVYFLHLAVVRDFSQSRVGLAVAIYLLSLTVHLRLFRFMLTLFAVTVHLTIVPLIFLWPISKWIAKRKKSLFIAIIVGVLIVLMSQTVLNALSFIDPRVALYQQWNADLYGAPVSSYGEVWKSIFVVAIGLIASGKSRRTVVLPFIIMQIFSISVFFGMKEFAIFAHRLSNVVSSFYPFLIGILSKQVIECRSIRKGTYRQLSLTLMFSLFFLVLVFRPGSVDIVKQIQVSGVGKN